MKKTLCSLAIICAIASQTKAQISFAPVVGLNVAKMGLKSSNGYPFNPDNIVGANVGLSVRFPIDDKMSIQPALVYTMKGFNFNVGSEGIRMDFKSIELPINLTYSLTGDNSEGFYLLGGPYVCYALSGKMEVKSNGTSQSADLKFNDEDGIGRTDFGANLGAGYRLNNGLMIQAQYGIGLSNVANKSVFFSEMKNKVFGFTLGYFIKGKKA